MIPLVGYANKLTVRPNETIDFKVSSSATKPFHASLVKIICSDPNPNGPGQKFVKIKSKIEKEYPSSLKTVKLGSYAKIKKNKIIRNLKDFTFSANIWSTTPSKNNQGIISFYDQEEKIGLALGIFDGCIGLIIGEKNTKPFIFSTKNKIKIKKWYKVWISFHYNTSTIQLGQVLLNKKVNKKNSTIKSTKCFKRNFLNYNLPLVFAALGNKNIINHFNGKLESPQIYNKTINVKSANQFISKSNQYTPIIGWDFSKKIKSTYIVDIGKHKYNGQLFNLPTRGMIGSNWSGKEMNWNYLPEEYGAIHFHEDDIYDCDWKTDFSLKIPKEFKSGAYAVILKCMNYQDAITFFVSAIKGKPKSNLCVLIPTFTYLMYCNHARSEFSNKWRSRAKKWKGYQHNPSDHRSFGLSTYNFHTDGSGICHTSRLRPILTLKPGYITFVDKKGSGLRHFQADTHLLDWLEKQKIDYDIITDEDLHKDGFELLKHYQTLMTTSHPEYHTEQTLKAIYNYTSYGGNLIYLGGNGFYWKIVPHEFLEGVYEIRRGEGGIRAWAAEPGEYYSAFDGSYGGLWRRNGFPPQKLVGVGFSGQGHFEGSYYKRTSESYESKYSWIFKNIKDDKIGNFGLSGGGAAGFELDRADQNLGTPENAVVLARSENHNKKNFMLVPEEQLTPFYNLPNKPLNELICAEIVYFQNEKNGKVFSVGSITFCGSLYFNKYKNSISQLLKNIIKHFIKTKS